MGDEVYVYCNHHVKGNLQDKRYVSAWFHYVFMFLVKRKDERMKDVNHKIYESKREQDPHRTQKAFAFEALFVQVGNYVMHPRQHCHEHEQEIQYAVEVQERVEEINCVVFVQNAPGDIRNKVTVCNRKKILVVDNGFLFVLKFCRFSSDRLKSLSVQYEIKY